METKKNSKKISLGITIVTVAIILLLGYRVILSGVYSLYITIPVLLEGIVLTCAYYFYLKRILEDFQNKNTKTAMVLLIILLLGVLLLGITYGRMNRFFQKILTYFLFFLGTIIANSICIGALLKKSTSQKKWKKGLCYSVIILLIATALPIAFFAAKVTVQETTQSIKKHSLSYLFASKNKIHEQEKQKSIQGRNKILSDYLNKQEKQGYLTRQDVMNVIRNTGMTYKMEFNYQEKNSTNQSREEIEKIVTALTASYYKVQYEYDNNQNVTKIIFQDMGGKSSLPEEKNESIVLTAQGMKLSKEMVRLIRKADTQGESISYVYENEMMIPMGQEKELTNFRLGLCYQNEEDNYLPLEGSQENYDKIKGYKVYSTGIEITLQEGVKLKRDYYTLRINRYDEEGNLEKGYDYHYVFEPVVTKMENSQKNTVLEIRFPMTFPRKQLKNIEIIFGEME